MTKNTLVFLFLILMAILCALGTIDVQTNRRLSSRLNENIENFSSPKPVVTVPTPSWPYSEQPSCGLSMLSMAAAEIVHTNITPTGWGLGDDKSGYYPADLLTAWQAGTHRTATPVLGIPATGATVLKFGHPYFWFGLLGTNGHTALCYFSETNIMIKNGVFDSNNGTNLEFNWNYHDFRLNTLGVYDP